MNRLGDVAFQRQQYDRTKSDYLESLAILRDFGERLLLASTLARYGEVCIYLVEIAHARESLLASLKLSQEISAVATIPRALSSLAALLAKEGEK